MSRIRRSQRHVAGIGEEPDPGRRLRLNRPRFDAGKSHQKSPWTQCPQGSILSPRGKSSGSGDSVLRKLSVYRGHVGCGFRVQRGGPRSGGCLCGELQLQLPALPILESHVRLGHVGRPSAHLIRAGAPLHVPVRRPTQGSYSWVMLTTNTSFTDYIQIGYGDKNTGTTYRFYWARTAAWDISAEAYWARPRSAPTSRSRRRGTMASPVARRWSQAASLPTTSTASTRTSHRTARDRTAPRSGGSPTSGPISRTSPRIRTSTFRAIRPRRCTST